jgi:Cof subfamily protein (haloacid dehalogenase superfamily)
VTSPVNTKKWVDHHHAHSGRIRLCAVDVDGTLLNSAHQLAPHTAKAVADAHRRGVTILLATSRAPSALKPVLQQLPSLSGAEFIGSQGAITGRYQPDGTLVVSSQQTMPLQLARDVARGAGDLGISVSWYSGEHWYVSHVDHTVERESTIVGVAPTIHDLKTLRVGPDKLMLISPDGRPDTLTPLKRALPTGLRAQISNPTYLEITRDDVDKAAAVEAFCALNGIDSAEVLAIGDGPNDLGMFAFAGVSVAPANARPEVLAAADYITASNDDHGLANVLSPIRVADAEKFSQ